MSITDELREWAHGFNGPWRRNEEMLLAIADRIDAEHKRLTDKAHADGERSAMKQVRSKSMDYKKGYEQAMADVEERTKTEQNGVGITQELRNYARNYERVETLSIELLAIADRIDERYRRDMATAQQVGINEGEDAAMREGWVKLPIDADGVPIRVGDVMEGEKIGGGFGEPFEVVGYIISNGELEPMDENKCPRKHVYLRHIQPDSWERIIEDALTVGWQNGNWSEVASDGVHDRLVERCKRLAGEGK